MNFHEMTADAVKAQLENLQAANSALPNDLVVSGPVHSNPHNGGPHPATRIFRGASPSLPYDLAIKAVDTDSKPDAGLWFQREADVLETLDAKQHHARPGLTACLHLADADSGLLVTEWLAGRNLRKHFYLNMFSQSRRNVGITAAGKWLRRLHDTLEHQTQIFDTSEFLLDIRNRIQVNSGDRRELHFRYLDVLETAAAKLADEPNTVSLQHGDFSPNNLVIANKNMDLRCFDFSNPRIAPIEIDCARFLLNRAVKLGADFSRDGGHSPWQQTPQWQAFSLGYFGAPNHAPGQWLSWYGLRALMERAPFLSLFANDGSRSLLERLDRRRELNRLESLMLILASDLDRR